MTETGPERDDVTGEVLDPEDEGGPDFPEAPEEDYPEGEAEDGDPGEADDEDDDPDVSDIEEDDSDLPDPATAEG